MALGGWLLAEGTWRRQLGAVGSGNHLIEVSFDEMDAVWLFLHSGSRGVGNKIHQKYVAVAPAHVSNWRITLPDADLAYPLKGTPEFTRYIGGQKWAEHFALLNPEEMMGRVIRPVSGCLELPS